METMDDLTAKARAIKERISELQDKQRATDNAPHVGKCFKYRNNYSCPEKPSDYWWIYFKITGIAKDGSLEANCFEVDKYGRVTARDDHTMYWLSDEYKPIPKSEFDRAWKRMLGRIKEIDPR